jgi:TetR/AcrR family transcriptional repressor of mexCD-oprJ operon
MSSPTRALRADAARNRDAILDAALLSLGTNPHASMTDIAAAAGVGRVTVYGHFSSRDDLLEALIVRTIERAEAEFSALDLSGPPGDALELLVRRSWRIVDNIHGLLAAAEEAFSTDKLLRHHQQPQARIEELLKRGQADGTFRRDLEAAWLTSCITAIVHTAAGDLRKGRLAEAGADRVVTATVMSLVMPRASERAAVPEDDGPS